MSTFYAIDSTRVTHREYWWGTRSPLVIIGWLLKWLRIRIPGSTDDPNVDSTLPFVVESLPVEVASRFQPLADELTRLGFAEPVYHVIHDAGTSTTIYWATFRHQPGQHFARIHQRIWRHTQSVHRRAFVLFFTAFTDGAFVVSSSGKSDLDAPASIYVQRMKATPSVLWQAHERLAAAQWQKTVQPIRTREELLGISEQHHALLRDFHLARGVFRPRTVSEQAQVETFASTVAQAQASGLQHAEVLAELERLQTHKPGWGNAVILLLVSVAAFVAAGTAQQNWKITLWLIPILLLHESGHWLAMKIFGYRNLRMFFIPLFGAAVTGRNWNVPGWKKGLVALAGPVPGIALGVAFTLAGLITGHTWLKMAALLLLLINGFNLLPMLPLDGGHLLHATLFCRNRWLDITFRIAAIGGLLLLSIAGMGKFLMYIGIAMAVGLPIAFKMSKVTDALRRTTLPPPLPGEDRIPVASAQIIIGAVKAQMPAKSTNKSIAQLALNVFETLNARPPGVLGTLGLLTIQGGAIVLTLLCGFLLILDKHGGGLGAFASAALRQPQHTLDCGSHARWSGEAAAPAGPCNTTVTTFRRHIEAQGAFAHLTNQLPPTASLCLVGDSLLLKLPADDDASRERWFTELQKLSTNTFVALTNRTVLFSMMCIAPTASAATNLEEELRDYFHVAGLAEFIPPWAPTAGKAEFESKRLARRTWGQIDESMGKLWQSSDTKALKVNMAAAMRRGAQAEMERLSKEQTRMRKDLETQTYARLRAGGCDAELLDFHARLAALHYTNRIERASVVRQMAVRLGGVSSEDGDSAKPAPRYDATGYVVRHGLLLEMRWMGFKDATTGVPALMDWLCQKRCRNLKYDMHAGSSYVDDSDE